MSTNSFLQPLEFYQRDLNPIGHYVRQMAKALSIQFGTSEEVARTFIIKNIREKKFPNQRDPLVKFFGRDENLDRTEEELTLSEYFRDVKDKNQILVPTFTAYCSEEEDKSPLSSFIGYNVKKRSEAKKLSQKAKDEGDLALAFSKNIEQANKKENNNSLSGAFATDSSVFENDTGHNPLTSITRSMASIGNALNERIIGGNRFYNNKVTIQNNIFAIITLMDEEATDEAIRNFNLHTPSPEELIEVVKHSSKFYVFDNRTYSDLLAFFYKLTPNQRAALAYNQDFYHLRKFNPGFVREMLTNFATVSRNNNYQDPVSVIKKTDDLVRNYAHQVMIFEMQGKGKDYDKLDPATQQALAGVCENINTCVENYRSIIKAFFLTRTVPNSTAFIQDMVRQDVVLSDTDSTMFSVDEWVKWHFGDLTFTQEAFGIAGAVMFMATQCISHCLAILSANMGVAKDKMFVLSMKPEFVFPVFVQSPVAKHYFTAKLVCEGSVYKDIEMEIKGVHNKNSALPGSIIKPLHQKFEDIIRGIMAGGRIDLYREIVEAADIERRIMQSLSRSEVEYLKRSNIKEASAYGSGPLTSNFAFHTLWNEVFAPKYGPIDPPPYDVVKIPTTLTSPAVFKNWLANMQDRALAQRLETWAVTHNKKKITTFYFNLDMILASAIPAEVMSVIDMRKIVLDLTNSRRMLLDSLGSTVRTDFLLTEMGY